MYDLEQHIMECWQLVDDVNFLYKEVMDKIEKGKYIPMVDKVIPMKDIRDAHEYLENRQQMGKVVVVPSATSVESMGVYSGGGPAQLQIVTLGEKSWRASPGHGFTSSAPAAASLS